MSYNFPIGSWNPEVVERIREEYSDLDSHGWIENWCKCEPLHYNAVSPLPPLKEIYNEQILTKKESYEEIENYEDII